MKQIGWLSLVAVALLPVGCSSSESASNSTSCGEGTVLENGKCVTAPVAQPATDGGVRCGEGTVEKNGVCVADTSHDAGTTIVDSGSSTRDSSVLADSSQPVEADSSCALDVVEDDGADSQESEAASPVCLPATIDCSNDCGEHSAKCVRATCDMSMQTITLTDTTDFPIVIRTPSNPGVMPECESQCGAGNVVAGIRLRTILHWLPSGAMVRIETQPPWMVMGGDDTNDGYCIRKYRYPIESCAVRSPRIPLGGNGDKMSYSIITRDPNAPAAYVRFSIVYGQAEGPCN